MYIYINLYRPPGNEGQIPRLAQRIASMTDPSHHTIICGDFNIDYRKSPSNLISAQLKELGFHQIVTEPTTIRGSCLDHVYVGRTLEAIHKLHYPYYSDHEAIRVVVRKKLIIINRLFKFTQ